MLNKKDPLIGAVQEVMKRNQIEREATRLVNEAFGIEDRKALPHEYQAEWDAAYQQVLAEATHPSNYSEKQKRFAATAGNPKKIDSADLAHVRKHGGKHIEERKLNPYAVGMAAVKKSTGDEPPMEKKNIMKAHKIAKKIMKKSMDESAGAPGGMVDYMQKKAKREAAQKNAVDAKAPGMGGPNYNPNKSLDAKAPGMGGPNYVPNKGMNNAPPKPKVKPVAAAPKAAAPKAKAPKAVAPQPKKKLTSFQKSMINQKGNTEDQKRQLERRYGVRAPMKKAKKSVFGEQIRDIIAEKAMGGMVAQQQAQQNQPKKPGSPMPVSGEKNTSWFSRQTDMQRATKDMGKMDKLRRMQSNPPALDATQKTVAQSQAPMRQAQNRQDLAKSVQAGRAGTNTALNRAPASSGVSGNPMGDYNPGQEYSTPTSPQSQAQSNMSPTVKTRPDLPVARKKAEPIKVSDTEVMNDPKFKKAVSSVGGTQAAKKIQTGERVAGLGRFNKGDTIMSRVRTDIAARKNVGRES